MEDIDIISKEYIISPQAVKLNDYFFKDEEFIKYREWLKNLL